MAFDLPAVFGASGSASGWFDESAEANWWFSEEIPAPVVSGGDVFIENVFGIHFGVKASTAAGMGGVLIE